MVQLIFAVVPYFVKIFHLYLRDAPFCTIEMSLFCIIERPYYISKYDTLVLSWTSSGLEALSFTL